MIPIFCACGRKLCEAFCIKNDLPGHTEIKYGWGGIFMDLLRVAVTSLAFLAAMFLLTKLMGNKQV